MPAKRLVAQYPDDTIVVVPIPLSVALAIGCRPNATVRLHIVDGDIRVVSDTIQTGNPTIPRPAPNATNMWESCQSWWKERGATKGMPRQTL